MSKGDKKMGDTRSKKILVSLDQSEPSMEAVRYVAGVPPFRDYQVVLLHIFTEVAPEYWDLGGHAGYEKRVSDVKLWELQARRGAETFMKNARDILIHAGFPESAIKSLIQNRDKGTAEDVIRKAMQGFKAVALGRKSMSTLRNIVMGSVSAKLVERLTEVPIFLVGKVVNTKRFLIAFDGSDNAMRIVDYAGATLGKESKVILLHVIRGSDPAHVKAAEAFIHPLLEQARAKLIEYGMPSNHVSVKLITDVSSRAGAIVSEAGVHHCGTIVVGRRGLSKVQEFFMGGVSNKVVQIARNLTVWIIN
jgi:nucleotide-binding universal stress UspA family protein